jgi:membrane dipeptidase
MIQALTARGGVIHITFHDCFLSQEYANANRALASEIASHEEGAAKKFGENEARNLMELQRVSNEATRAGKLPQVSWEKIVDHIDRAVGLAGAEHVGVGSDFDGAFMPAGMEDASKFPLLTEGLLDRGYGETDIRKILGENTLRVMEDAARIGKQLQAEKS